LVEEAVSETGSHAQFEPVSSRFEFVVGHDRSVFLGWHRRVKVLPIVKSLLGAVGETYNRYG
jgi:hypothetical protein